MGLEGKWKAVIIGGVIMGLAPLVPLLNLACCLIPFAAGVIAVAVYAGSTPPPVLKNNDAIVLGVVSSLVGAAIYAVLVIPIVFLLGNILGGFLGQAIPDVADVPARMQPLIQGLLAHFGSILVLIVILKVLGHLALSLVFGILGGITGVALFRRSKA